MIFNPFSGIKHIDDSKVKRYNLIKYTWEKNDANLYDPACDYIEICIALPRSQNAMHYSKGLNIYVDGKQQEYTFSSRTIFGKKYIMFLVEDVGEWESLKLERGNEIVEIHHE